MFLVSKQNCYDSVPPENIKKLEAFGFDETWKITYSDNKNLLCTHPHMYIHLRHTHTHTHTHAHRHTQLGSHPTDSSDTPRHMRTLARVYTHIHTETHTNTHTETHTHTHIHTHTHTHSNTLSNTETNIHTLTNTLKPVLSEHSADRTAWCFKINIFRSRFAIFSLYTRGRLTSLTLLLYTVCQVR